MLLHLGDLESGGSRGGRIWFSIGEACFPEEGWYDLPGILLENWMPSLRSFADGHTDFCELSFMDGPYVVRLRRVGERVTVSCLERGRAVQEQVQIDFSVFWKSVQKCVRCYERVKYLENK